MLAMSLAEKVEWWRHDAALWSIHHPWIYLVAFLLGMVYAYLLRPK